MSEVSMMIPVESFHLEALYKEGHSSETAVLCHPHPLYGGDMDNSVISALMKAMWQQGWGTLRFNFRGVGGSGGEYAEGEGEVEDLLAVVSYLADHGATSIHLAGYSFGAWIALKAIHKGLQAGSLILVSPPLDHLPFWGLALPAKPSLITLGDKDGFCAVSSLMDWLESQHSAEAFTEVKLLSGCDHFYRRHEETLSLRVAEFLESHFRPNAS